MEINADQFLFSLYQSLINFSICICHYMQFLFVLLHAAASEFRSTVTCKFGSFFAGVSHTFEIVSLVLLINWKYRIPSKTLTKYLRIFVFFS